MTGPRVTVRHNVVPLHQKQHVTWQQVLVHTPRISGSNPTEALAHERIKNPKAALKLLCLAKVLCEALQTPPHSWHGSHCMQDANAWMCTHATSGSGFAQIALHWLPHVMAFTVVCYVPAAWQKKVAFLLRLLPQSSQHFKRQHGDCSLTAAKGFQLRHQANHRYPHDDGHGQHAI